MHMMSLARNRRWPSLAAVVGSVAVLTPSWTAAQQGPSLSNDQLQLVVARLADSATHSWELGTRAQALLELNSPFYSVFSNTTLPPPASPPTPSLLANLTDVISIARNTVSLLKNGTSPSPLVAKDGAAGDPASIGVAVLLANLTNAPPPVAPSVNVTATNTTNTTITTSSMVTTTTADTTTSASPTESSGVANSTTPGTNGTNTNVTVVPPTYSDAATSQLEFLLTSVPRTSDGAISHRVSQVQLWSDFIYMAPPFLAYYGVMNQNQTLVTESYNQIKLYRNYLRDASAHNLWKHIQMGTGTDDGHWSTGNGWAASGMLRVLATIKNSNLSSQFAPEQIDLQNWVTEILDGMYSQTTTSSIFHNYADNTSTFSDCSSTALIAAATYRLAVLTQTYSNLPHAEKSRQSISDGSHIDSNGWLTPVVNPLDWSSSGSRSPEGQAFVVEMQAAWKDWVAIGSPGANSARRSLKLGAAALCWSAVAPGLVLGVVLSVT